MAAGWRAATLRVVAATHPAPPKSELPAQSTRNAILAEALRCFAEHGYEARRSTTSPAAVGIRRPSLLHHFPSKEALYREVFEGALVDWYAQVEGAAEGPRRLAAWSTACSRPASTSSWSTRSSSGWCGGRRWRGAGGSASSSARCSTPLPRAVAFFEREMGAGRLRPQDPEQLLLTGYGALLSYFSDVSFLEALLGHDPLTRDALEQRLEHVRAFFRAALEPDQ